MREINAIAYNGYRVASTFSGAGGSSLGYRLAGFRVVYANEFIAAARETYAANFPETPLDDRDIRSVSAESLLEIAGVARGELDLLDGSPPCASFSTAGRREKHWGKVKTYSDGTQRTDDLFFEFIRILDGVRPKTFVAENVSGLAKGTAKGYFLEILAAFKAAGYRVRAASLNAQWLGVPQSRQRIIFVGVRDDLAGEPSFPPPLAYRYSVRDALPWIERISGNINYKEVWRDAGTNVSATIPANLEIIADRFLNVESLEGANGFNKHKYQTTNLPAPTIQATRPLRCKVEPESDMSGYAVGAEWDGLKQGETSEKYFSLSKPHLDAPCPTVTASGGLQSLASVTHPTERRKFSIAELRRISSFPDDFVLTGTYAQQWERIGRAVPPMMMYYVAANVRDAILATAAPR